MKNNKNIHYVGIADIAAAIIAGGSSDKPGLFQSIAGIAVIVLTIFLIIRLFELRKDKTSMWLLLYIAAAVLISLGGMIAHTP
jgi:hypothetical protein